MESVVQSAVQSADLLFVWVKYGTGQAVEVSVPSTCNVSRLIKVIKTELELTERLFDIYLHKPEEERKEEGGGEETAYEPYVAVSDILRDSVGIPRNPILIRTTQQAPGPPPAVEQTPVSNESNKILIKGNKMLIKVLKKHEKTMSAVLEVLEEIGDKDCYDRISESSKPRELAKSDYELAYRVAVADLKCMITGISQSALIAAAPTSPKPKNPVTLSHLLARNAEAKERLSLGYGKADIENIRNSILLCKGIEEAFNHKFLSFVPTDKPFSNNRYKLHIWVDAIKTEPIYEGAALTIGSFDGAALDLTVGSALHNPFKRALSYQAFRAFKMWCKGFGLTELPEDSDTSVYQGAYKQKRIAYAQQLAKDAAADADDDEEQDDAVDEESGDENI